MEFGYFKTKDDHGQGEEPASPKSDNRNRGQDPVQARRILVKPDGSLPLPQYSVGTVRDTLLKVDRLLELNGKERANLIERKADLLVMQDDDVVEALSKDGFQEGSGLAFAVTEVAIENTGDGPVIIKIQGRDPEVKTTYEKKEMDKQVISPTKEYVPSRAIVQALDRTRREAALQNLPGHSKAVGPVPAVKTYPPAKKKFNIPSPKLSMAHIPAILKRRQPPPVPITPQMGFGINSDPQCSAFHRPSGGLNNPANVTAGGLQSKYPTLIVLSMEEGYGETGSVVSANWGTGVDTGSSSGQQVPSGETGNVTELAGNQADPSTELGRVPDQQNIEIISFCEKCAQKEAWFQCSGCSARYYCSVECQTADWESHSFHCT